MMYQIIQISNVAQYALMNVYDLLIISGRLLHNVGYNMKSEFSETRN